MVAAVEVAVAVAQEAGKDNLNHIKSGTRLTLIERLVPLFFLFKDRFDF